MRKIFLLLPFILWSCGGEPSKFDETAYIKTQARDRIKIVSFDFNNTTYDEVLQHAKKQMNTAGRMTAVYYFHKTDKMPLSGFNTTKSISRANYVLYESGIVDEWKYAYVLGYSGYYEFADCTVSKDKRSTIGICQGD